jgi:hypothetical protein
MQQNPQVPPQKIGFHWMNRPGNSGGSRVRVMPPCQARCARTISKCLCPECCAARTPKSSLCYPRRNRPRIPRIAINSRAPNAGMAAATNIFRVRNRRAGNAPPRSGPAMLPTRPTPSTSQRSPEYADSRSRNQTGPSALYLPNFECNIPYRESRRPGRKK